MRFAVVIHKEDDSDFGVTVPDLPGCFSAGSTMDEALDMAHEAIEGHVELLFEDGHPLPTPLNIAHHMSNPDYADGVWAYIDVDTIDLMGKTERFNVTLPSLLVKKVDAYLSSSETIYRSRSDFLAKVAADRLNEAMRVDRQ